MLSISRHDACDDGGSIWTVKSVSAADEAECHAAKKPQPGNFAVVIM